MTHRNDRYTACTNDGANPRTNRRTCRDKKPAAAADAAAAADGDAVDAGGVDKSANDGGGGKGGGGGGGGGGAKKKRSQKDDNSLPKKPGSSKHRKVSPVVTEKRAVERPRNPVGSRAAADADADAAVTVGAGAVVDGKAKRAPGRSKFGSPQLPNFESSRSNSRRDSNSSSNHTSPYSTSPAATPTEYMFSQTGFPTTTSKPRTPGEVTKLNEDDGLMFTAFSAPHTFG